MEALLSEQQASGKRIESICTNFGKDGPQRWTKPYLIQKMSQLHKEWSEFRLRHQELEKQSSGEEEYFKRKYYENIESLQLKYSDKILNELERTQGDTKEQSKSDDKDIRSHLNIFRHQRAAIDAMTRLIRQTAPEDSSRAFYEKRQEAIKNYWNIIVEGHQQIMTLERTNDYDVEEYFEVEDEYLKASIKLQEGIDKLNDTSKVSDVKLPRITLPTFNGQYTKWIEFKDLYTELIHKRQINGAQKLHYLKANLVGEPSKMLQHFSTTDTNYDAAWNTLLDRYDNKRLLVTALLNDICQQGSITTESSGSIKRLLDTTKDCMSAILNIGVDVSSWDPIVLHLILQKLDKESRRLYEQSLKSCKELQTLADFYVFLTSRYQTIEAISSKEEKRRPTSLMTSASEGCAICKINGHSIKNCRQFLKKNHSSRCELVKKLNLCFNCLLKGHQSSQCTSNPCKQCNKRHHLLLHKEIANTSLKAIKSQKQQNEILLATAVVEISNQHGTNMPCRAVLDSGSQLHFISERICQELGLPRTKINIPIAGIGETEMVAKYYTTVLLQSRTTRFQSTIEAIILPKISEAQPTIYLETEGWNIPTHTTLADPEFNRPQRIDLLLGAELYLKLMAPGQIDLGPTLPTLQNTRLGWIVGGRASVEGARNNVKKLCSIATKYGTSTLERQIERFWELEHHVEEHTPISQEEMTCEIHFQETMKRHSDGRYVVQLPFKHNPEEIGQSEGMAMKRFLSLERKLAQQPVLQQLYHQFMKEYEEEGHMTMVPRTEVPVNSQFIPHHGILKPDSSSTKLRVVFDASAKTSKGTSLNQAMMVGPTVQSDLFSIMVKFRLHRYAFAADIRQMYRQILIDENHRKYQTIFWRTSPSDPIRTYQLNTVTYGTSAAPYLATRCLKELAHQNQTTTPRASQVIIEETYVDDILTGADTKDEALKLRDQLIAVLKQGKFELRKFCANNAEILADIPREHQEKTMSIHQRDVVKTLGLIWEPNKDIFFFHCPNNFGESLNLTKRIAYSEISRLFDPLGIIGPVVVLGKLFMQELWKSKTAWDEPLTVEQQKKWEAYKVQLYALSKISIPRCTIPQNPSQIQLHAFSDSSMAAFGACCYIRAVDANGNISVSLLCAKSRVAPLKITTLARLELCAAVLMAELVERLLKTLTISISQVHYYTDSTTVLSWISSPSYTWETFVANRVARIQSLSNTTNWHHIAGKNNPADLISRGLPPIQLLDASIWFKGPDFLNNHEESWQFEKSDSIEEAPERRATKSALSTTVKESICDISIPIHKPGSLLKLQRIIAYCYRFINNTRMTQMTRQRGMLNCDELKLGLEGLLRNTQLVSFHKEYKQLKQKTSIDHSSTLLTLQPFMDNTGLMRVGGRLRNSELDVNMKHPILLPKRSTVSQLLLRSLHEEHMHAGPQALVSLSRQKYWIMDAKRAATETVHNCIRCFRAKPQPIEQLMGNLPRPRVTPARAFLNTGVDFAGPVKIFSRIRGRAPTKGYIAVFVCFSTKAIHLEVVSDLTTEAFLNALKRFISRRGYCLTVSCDNATNFVGAKSELSRLRELFDSQHLKESLHQYCQSKSIDWKFIPPRAPHFGGLWEAAVKSAKQLLIRCTGMAPLTYEELNTVLTQIEAILNSRPITPMSNDPNDLEALTPGHFLIGEPLCSFPEPDMTDKNIDHLRRFQRLQHIQQIFWKRWSTEYITTLQNRRKWKTSNGNIMPGELVIIKEDNIPPLQWPLGKIIKCYYGEDNIVRVVDVKTKNGIFKRAIARICPLPGQEEIQATDEKVVTENNEEVSITEPSKPATISEPVGLRKRNLKNEDKPAAKRVRSMQAQKVKNPSNRIHPINPKWLENPIAMVRRQPQVTTGRALMSILVVLCCIFPSKATSTVPVTTNPINSTAGIYFERIGQTKLTTDEWNIVIFHNTTSYFQELNVIKKALDNMAILCEKTLYYTTNCRITLAELKYQHETAVEMDNVILSQNYARSRRSLFDGVGIAANKLFGIMDQEDAERLETDVRCLQQNQEHLNELTKRQTTVLNSTLNILERSQKHTEEQLASINTHMLHIQKAYNVVTKTLDETRAMLLFNSMVGLISLSFARFHRSQITIIDAITDAHHGKISSAILTPNNLLEQLQFIKLHLPPNTEIPSEELRVIYSFTHVSTRVTSNGIIFNVKIPLVQTSVYDLYKVIPLPIAMNGHLTYVNPTTEYIAITLQRDNYIKLGADDINNCLKTDDKQTFVCTGRHPVYIYKENNSPCELNFFNHVDNPYSGCTLTTVNENQVWIQLRTPNRWIYSTLFPQSINVVCGTQVHAIQIQGLGELSMKDKCILETKVAKIHSLQEIETTVSSPFIPFANLSTAISLNNDVQQLSTEKPFPALVFEHSHSYREIKSQLAETNTSMFPLMSKHDIHQYGILYGAMIILAVYAVYRWWSARARKTMTPVVAKAQTIKNHTGERFTVEIE